MSIKGRVLEEDKISGVFETKVSGDILVVEDNGWDNVTVKFVETGNEKVATRVSIQKGNVRDRVRFDLVEGTVYSTKNNGTLVIQEYINSYKVVVKFLLTGHVKTVNKRHILLGNVRDPYYPAVQGIGYLGEGIYSCKKGVKNPAHKAWSSMLKRCYGTDYTKKDRTYEGCTVDPLWFNFQNFASWYTPLHFDHAELDKDLLLKGNKVYSPVNCTLLPKEINTTLTKNEATRSSLGIGIAGRYEGSVVTYRSCSIKGTTYKTKEEAYIEYKHCKESRLYNLSIKYSDVLQPNAIEALVNYTVEEDD